MENQQVIQSESTDSGLADVGANDNDQRLIVSFGANKHSDFFNGGRRGKRLTTRVFVSDNFQRHAEGSVKDAAAFCPGILRDETARKPDDGVVNRFQENVVALGVLAYDVDGAQTYADAIANLGGVKFLGYSSYSHLKQPGVEKFRIVIFLTVPIVATTGEMTRVVESVGDHYGIKFDRSKRTPESLFYLPRHDGSEASRRNAFIDLAHLNGAPFDPTPFIEAAKGAVAVESAGREEKRAEREVRKAAQEAARQATAKKYTTPWLADFIGRLGDVFDMPGCVAACVDAAKDRSPVTLPCPNEQHHTGRGDGRHTCFVYAKGDPDGEGGLRETPGAFCNHGTCKATLKPWDMFDLICAKHGIELTHALDYVPAEARKVYEASAGLPLGFEVRDGAIWTWSDKKYVRVCDVFEIVGRVCDERDGQWGTEIRFQNGKGNSCSVVVNNAELHDGDKALRARLAGAGLKIETGAPLHFLRLMNGLHAERIVTAVTKPGWYGLGTSEPIYVTVRGDVLGATDPESWRLAESGGAKDRDAKGSLEGWKRSIVGAVESTLNWAPHHAWGLMTGLAGPLLDLMGLSSFSFYYLGETSSGKSTTQIIEAAAAGNPRLDMCSAFPCLSTTNAMEGRCARTSGATLVLDETALAPTGFVAEFAFMYSGETGKARSNRDASKIESRYNWRGVATMSGESPIESHLARAGRGRSARDESTAAGAHVRLSTIQFPKPDGRNSATVDAIKEAARVDYGHALRAFVEYLIAKGYHTSAELLAELRKRLHTYTQEIASKDSTSPLQRTAEHFALVRLAGELAREAGLLGTKIDPARVVAWAWGAFQESEEAQALDPVARAIEKLTTWIQTEPNKIAPLVSNENEGTGRTGFEGIFAWRGKMEYHGKAARAAGVIDTVLLRSDKFQEVVGPHVPKKNVLAALHDKGALWRQGNNNEWTKAPKPVGNVKHYRIWPDALGITVDDVVGGGAVATPDDCTIAILQQLNGRTMSLVELVAAIPLVVKLDPWATMDGNANAERTHRAEITTRAEEAAALGTRYTTEDGEWAISRAGFDPGRGGSLYTATKVA